jgi:glycosyltransferase involved in cell wall biosynthesis
MPLSSEQLAAKAKAVRVLHLVGHMQRHGAEAWLMDVLRNVHCAKFQFDFLVHADKDYDYSQEIRCRGARQIVCPWPALPSAYLRRFARILQTYGPYDIVHSHLNHFGGWLLRRAQAEGVPCRILHHHSGQLPRQVPWPLRALGLWDRRLGSAATHVIAVSQAAAQATYGPDWNRVPNLHILPCGIDVTRFVGPVEARSLRRQFGLQDDVFVIGHAGRFTSAKNHAFIVAVASEISRMAVDIRFLLVGDGPLKRQTEKKVAELGLSGRVIFAGSRPDVPSLMQACMDAFILPSHYEGLCLALVEAQAAGLCCVISDAIPQEAVVCPELVKRLTTRAQPRIWADRLLACRQRRNGRCSPEQAREMVMQSQLNIRYNIEQLLRIYCADGRTATFAI